MHTLYCYISLSNAYNITPFVPLNVLRYGTSQKLRQQAYFSLVHPHLEYYNTVLNPYIEKEVNKIENIQHRAVGFLLNNYIQRGSVSAWINHLRWDSLENRTQLSCLLLMYRIQNQLIAINGNHCLTQCSPPVHNYKHIWI